MSLSVSLDITTCNTNTTTTATLTISGAVQDQWAEDFGYIYSNNNNVKLSLDNTTFTDEVVPTNNGTYTLYIQVGDIASTSSPTIFYEFYTGTDWVENSFDIEFVSDEPVVNIESESLNFSLSPNNATIQFTENLTNGTVNVGTSRTGALLDYNYRYEAERVAEQGLKTVVNGSAYATKLLNTLITYHVTYEFKLATLGFERPKFSDHLTAISSAIGIPITRIGADFYPKTDLNIALRKAFHIDFEEYFSGSFAECLNRLIGWSNSVPMMNYRLYITNGHIYLIQQGYEQNIYEPTNWALRPTITHSIRHTEWANSQYQTIIPKEITSSDAANSNEPFNGTLSWGSSTLTYVDGYLTQEQKGNVTTTYGYTDYDGNKYLTSKQTVDTDEDTSVESTYDYETTGTQRYLFEEIVEEYSGASTQTPILEKSTTTRHVPIGGGWYGTTVYDTTSVGTEEEISSSLSQGAPGNKASQYLIDAQNDALKPSNATRQMKVPLNGVGKARQSYPIADRSTLQAIANKLDTYEGSEEITLQGELVGGNHIFTYNDKIVYNNATYYLVSNSVSRNYNSIRQNIVAVRWVTT